MHRMYIRNLTSEELVVRPYVRVVNLLCPFSKSLTQNHNNAILVETMTFDSQKPQTPPCYSSPFRKINRKSRDRIGYQKGVIIVEK